MSQTLFPGRYVSYAEMTMMFRCGLTRRRVALEEEVLVRGLGKGKDRV